MRKKIFLINLACLLASLSKCLCCVVVCSPLGVPLYIGSSLGVSVGDSPSAFLNLWSSFSSLCAAVVLSKRIRFVHAATLSFSAKCQSMNG
ncbi:hypothetical protein ACS0TY_032559 [Phlomoides rotata]